MTLAYWDRKIRSEFDARKAYTKGVAVDTGDGARDRPLAEA